jgi:Helitron helicase-like domain at N-terminus
MVILPSSVTGSPRHMHEYSQDAMTYVRHFGRPDLFITFTCNSSWREIQENLLPGQTPVDRHDLIARVFKQKLTKLMGVICKGNIFGETQCWLYSIEWQKRGLPHAHILFWLKEKIHSTDVDKVISAELPDPTADPLLHELVTKNMMHGPCGKLNRNSPCMVDGKCTKRYPRALLQETQTGDDGYPLYKRRKPNDGGFTTKIKMRSDNGHQEIEIDNQWVVPYSPLLLKMFQAHINVEWCHSVQSIKYVLKYVHKGSDQAVFQVQKEKKMMDEVEAFQLGRYISSNEAVWRILGMPIHERYPTVVHLSVHLENGQRVYFNVDNFHPENLLEPPRTTLTAFFVLCQNDDFAKTLLYCDVPKYYTWQTSGKTWQRRKQGIPVEGHPGIRASDALGRVYTIHPSTEACFHLRILLHVVKGPTSYNALKTVNGHLFATFREACQERGLLENDQHWDSALSEAGASQSPHR